jgi:ferric-dicitrate binding protein FerR (iron transport regulator)
MTSIFQKTSLFKQNPDIDEKEALRKFKKHIRSNSRKKAFKPYYTLIGIAASIILIAGTIFFINNNNDEAKEFITITASAPKQYNLSEGIEINLSSFSEIRFREENKNEIELKGEAAFRVNSKEENIKICAGSVFVEDIGTVFTVSAISPEESVTVYVEEGEVMFYTLSHNGIIVKAGETGIYDAKKAEFTHVKALDVIDEDFNLNNEIVFYDQSLDDIISSISGMYNINIKIRSSDLRVKKLNVSFDRDVSADEMLMVITETLSAKLCKEGNSYVIFE